MTYVGLVSKDQNKSSLQYLRLNAEPTEDYTTLPSVGESFFYLDLKADNTANCLSVHPLNQRITLGLKEMEKLDNGWDTYQALKINPSSIDLSREFIQRFEERKQPEIAPNADGSVILLWKTLTKKITLYMVSGNEEALEWSIKDLKTNRSSRGTAAIENLISVVQNELK
ncbi:MAG: hypothetical protein NDI63_10225 [Pseudobdellovibrio sp.]|nr:hypothetical protein [Pseudobdellovibrio sp.]